MRITYDCPAEVQKALAPLLKKHAGLVPGWCARLNVTWDPEGAEPGAVMAVSVSPEYREVCMAVMATWLSGTPEAREDAIVHELAHIPLAPMVNLMRTFMAQVAEEAPLELVGVVLEEQWRVAYEGAVQDLTHAWLRR